MGCDIHVYPEYRDAKQSREHWYGFGGRFNPGRDYEMFELLAGVRGKETAALIEPRGVPENLSWQADDDYWMRVTDDKADSRESNEIAEADAQKYLGYGSIQHPTQPKRISSPDWHTASWLTLAEYEAVLGQYVLAHGTEFLSAEYPALAAALRSLESRGLETRIVFWFDN